MQADAERLLRFLEPDAALAGFEAAVAADPGDVAARCGRVRCLWTLRRTDEAHAELQRVRADFPGAHAPIHVASGTIALGLRDDLVHLGIGDGSSGRDDDAAKAEFAAALALDPDCVEARRGLAMAHRLSGWRGVGFKEALELARRVLDDGADCAEHPSLRVEQAWCAFDSGDSDEAMRLLEEALAAFPDDVEVLYAKVYIAGERYARTDWRTSLAELSRLADLGYGHTAAWHDLMGWHRVAWGTSGEGERFAETTKDHFTTAQRALPGLPSAVAGYWRVVTEFDDAPERTINEAAGDSVAELLAVAEARDRLGHAWDSLVLCRRARSSDAHVLRTVAGEVSSLTSMGRFREGRALAAVVLADCPSVLMRKHLAWLEFSDEREQTALALFTGCGDEGLFGRVTTMRYLDWRGSAEEVFVAELARDPSPRMKSELLNQYGHTAFDQRRHQLAVSRYDEALAAFWPDPVIEDNARIARRTAKRFFEPLRKDVRRKKRKPAVELRVGRAPLAELRALKPDKLTEAGLPIALPLRVQNRVWSLLTDLDKRPAWIRRLTWWIGFFLGFTFVAVAVGLPWLMLPSFGQRRTIGALTTTAVAAVLIAAFLSGVGLLVFARRLVQRLLAVLCVLVGGADLVTWQYRDGWGAVRAELLLAVNTAAVGVVILGMVFRTDHWATTLRRVHIYRLDPFASLVDDLLDLLFYLEYRPGLRAVSRARFALYLVERIARNETRTLLAPLRRRWLDRRKDVVLDRAFRLHVAGVAAATRDLKRGILSPQPDTWDKLDAKLRAMLEAVCQGSWDLLPYREPDSAARTWGTRLLVIARRLSILALPPLGLAIVQASGARVPAELAVLGYVLWPVTTLLLWLDPDVAKRLDTAGSLRDLGANRRAGE